MADAVDRELEDIRNAIKRFAPVPGGAERVAAMEVLLEHALKAIVTVSLPRGSNPYGGGALIRVHGPDGIRRYHWSDDVIAACPVSDAGALAVIEAARSPNPEPPMKRGWLANLFT